MRKMRLVTVPTFVVILALATVSSVVAGNDGNDNRFQSNKMNGYQEVASTGAISTTGNGAFSAMLDGDTIRYTLTYAAIEGGAVTQAHIHFGRRAVNGGVIAFLCSNIAGTPAAPATTPPACPSPGGTVTGTIRANDVIGPSSQGIEAGSFAEAVAALRAGAVYANVHSTRWPGGEIRGQVNEKAAEDADELDDDGDDD
jgi:hypothetical protein